MPKYKVRFEETQDWVHEYEVDAKDQTEALDFAREKFYAGEQSEESYLKDAQMTNRSVMECEDA